MEVHDLLAVAPERVVRTEHRRALDEPVDPAELRRNLRPYIVRHAHRLAATNTPVERRRRENATVTYPEDPGLVAVLQHLGVAADAVLGHGGEAWVYALDDDRIVRVLHAGGRAEHVRRRRELVDELARGESAFAFPKVIEINELDGRVFTFERRLRGRSVMDELRDCDGTQRNALIEAHLAAAAALGDLYLEPRGSFGDLIADEPIITTTWRAYLEQRIATNLARSTPDLHAIDPVALAAALPDTDAAAFVHLDAFAGNMLTDGEHITAVLDIGPTSVAGDRRLDPLATALYLTSREISPTSRPGDVDVIMSWLRCAGLEEWFEPMRRWLAAYWSFALDDLAVTAWSRSVLL
jgi:aminoglycoside phosphotransferase (APT) family kinase protein